METIDKARSPQDVETPPPGLYNLVCVAELGNQGNLVALHAVAHVLENHAGLTARHSAIYSVIVLMKGRQTVREGLTKEVGDTIVRACNRCHVRSQFNSFNFLLELQ